MKFLIIVPDSVEIFGALDDLVEAFRGTYEELSSPEEPPRCGDVVDVAGSEYLVESEHVDGRLGLRRRTH